MNKISEPFSRKYPRIQPDFVSDDHASIKKVLSDRRVDKRK